MSATALMGFLPVGCVPASIYNGVIHHVLYQRSWCTRRVLPKVMRAPAVQWSLVAPSNEGETAKTPSNFAYWSNSDAEFGGRVTPCMGRQVRRRAKILDLTRYIMQLLW